MLTNLNSDHPVARLRGIAALEREVKAAMDALVREAVVTAKQRGATWDQIGLAFGQHKSTVLKRFRDHVPEQLRGRRK